MQWTGDNYDAIREWAEDAVWLDQARLPGGTGKLISTLLVHRGQTTTAVPVHRWIVRLTPGDYIVFGSETLHRLFEPTDTEGGAKP